jgi:short-subunit dehydrogenase
MRHSACIVRVLTSLRERYAIAQGDPMHAKLKPLDEQVIVITGASSGIGLATAQAAAQAGALLVLAARSEARLAEIVRAIDGEGGQAIYVVADVGRKEDVQRIADAAVERFGRIDTWVNDAGVAIFGLLEQVSDADSRRLFDTNFWGVVYGSLAALPHLRRSGGALINIGSEVSDAVVPLQGMYSASKHAVKGFTDALRVEVAEVEKAPIAITLVQPTAVNTPYPQHARNYMDKEPKLPTPQLDPRKVADAILNAATKPTRDIKVGMMSKINTTVAKIAPALGEKLAAKQAGRQQYDQPPSRDPEGGLWHASGGGDIYGHRPAP